MQLDSESATTSTKGSETRAFLFLTVVLFPLLAVITVAGYGFAIWIWQLYAGPPGS